MNQKILVMGAAAILGVFAVGYGVKVVTNKNKGQKVEQAQQVVNKNNNETQPKEENVPFNFGEINSADDIKDLAVKTGPYTCYITENDKVNNVVYKSVISTNGNDKVYLENISSKGDKNRVWVVGDVYYIESTQKGETQRLKISGDMAKMYANFINAMFSTDAWKKAGAMQNNDKYEIKVDCKKGKVEIPAFDEKQFQGLDFNMNFGQ